MAHLLKKQNIYAQYSSKSPFHEKLRIKKQTNVRTNSYTKACYVVNILGAFFDQSDNTTVPKTEASIQPLFFSVPSIGILPMKCSLSGE